MVEGVHQGNIDQRIALYEQIGGDHLGKDLFQKTTNFIGRALSQIFSKDSNNKTVSNLIDEIKKNPEFGDRYADMAQAKLTSMVGSGKPLTGRVAAQVLSEINIARSETLAKQANIGINIDTYVKSHAQALMETAFGEEQGGIGTDLMTQEDKDSIKDETTQRLKAKFTQGSPSADQMKKELTTVAREHCRVKILNHNSAKIEEVVGTLKDDIKARFEESGEDGIVLSDAIIAAMKKKIFDNLAIASHGNSKLYESHDPAIEKAKKKVMDTIVETFTSITEAEGVPDNVKDILRDSLASDEIMLTKDISLSVLQGFKDGICDRIASAVNGDDRSDTALVNFTKETMGDLEKACKNPETQARRGGIDGYSLETVKYCLFNIAMKANNLDQGAGQAKAKAFYDACTQASDRQEDLTSIRMNTLVGHMALTAGLMPQIEYEQKFMQNNPDIPLGAKDMIQDIFTNVPATPGSTLQKDALALVKEHTSPPNGLPVDARVVIDRTDPQHPKPVLSFNSTVLVDPNLFAGEFGATTTVSSNPFGETVLTDQFVMDLARAPITFKGGGNEVLFDPQEARDAQTGLSKKDSAPGTILAEKFTQSCGGDKNQARALSILLNQSFAGSVAVACTKNGSMPTTGGGNVILGAGTDHGPFSVTSHGQGRYTVEYSAKVGTDMLTAGSMTNFDIPIQMVGPEEGRTCELELKATYDIDLGGVKATATEKDLTELIRFKEGSPGVTLKFVDK